MVSPTDRKVNQRKPYTERSRYQYQEAGVAAGLTSVSLPSLPSPSPVQVKPLLGGNGIFKQNRSPFEHQVLHSSQGLMDHAHPSHLQLVGNQHNSLPLECLLNALFKDMLPYMGIHSRERVIQQVELTVGIHGTGQADPLPLSPREIDTPLPNL